MSTLAADNGPFDPAAGQVPAPEAASAAAAVVRLPRGLYVKAAERLVSQEAGTRQTAARRFVSAAPSYGIDLSLMWGTLSGSGRSVRQVCLAVLGAGRTAMLFVSGARPEGEEPLDVAQRAACIEAACCHVAAPVGGSGTGGGGGGGGGKTPAVLAQALLEPDETAQAAGLEAAGFSRLGGLAYLALRRGRGGFGSGAPVAAPEGVTVRTAASIPAAERDDLLTRILEQSYTNTLDCPELCGLREARDVLESHRAVGTHDPNLWWVVFGRGAADGGGALGSAEGANGCMLLNPCPEQDSIELVYLGLSPGLRGRGVAGWLLDYGLRAAGSRREARVTCAVDLRNAPAMRLYERAGFMRMGERTPFVRGIGPQ